MRAQTQEKIAEFIHEHPGSTSKYIALRVGLSVGTVRKYLKYFREQGWVTRQTRWLDQFCYTWEYFIKPPTCIECGAENCMATVGGTWGVCNVCGYAWCSNDPTAELFAQKVEGQ